MSEPEVGSDEERVLQSGGSSDEAGFAAWRDAMPSFLVDGERFYLPSGDVPMDGEQLAEHWRRKRAAEASFGE